MPILSLGQTGNPTQIPVPTAGQPQANAAKQDGELQLDFTSDGYKGTYKLGDRVIALDNAHPTKDVSRSLIHDADGRDLVEIFTNKETLELTMAGVRIVINLNNPGPMNLSTDETKKLEDFRNSTTPKLFGS